jgi:hypothetical protein
MIEKCLYCEKKHDAASWRSLVRSGKIVHICDKYFKPTSTEHVPQKVREERKEYAKSILQPWREGEPSAEFMEAYPDQAKKMFTPRERIKAKEVWKDTLPSNWKKSK